MKAPYGGSSAVEPGRSGRGASDDDRYAALLAVTTDDVIVTPGASAKGGRQLNAGGGGAGALSYDVLVAAKDEAAAKALVTKANAIEPAASVAQLRTEMAKRPTLARMKGQVTGLVASGGRTQGAVCC